MQLLIDTARRGAKVRLLLDSFFDEPEALPSNQATVEYLATIAEAEGLDIVGAGHALKRAASSITPLPTIAAAIVGSARVD